MNKDRIEQLIVYARLLGELNTNEFFLHKEINEVVQELRNELNLTDK